MTKQDQLKLEQRMRSRPHLRAAKDPIARKGTKSSPRLYAVSRVLAYSNKYALGDAIRKKMVAWSEREAYRAEERERAVIHVKDGKPLTEYGARMLGVPWPLEKL